MPKKTYYKLDEEKIYKFLKETDIEFTDVKKLNNKTLKNLTSSDEKNGQIDVEKFNLNNNNNNNKNSNKDVIKKQYKDTIFLTDTEYKELIDRYGIEKIEDLINRLDLYKKSSGKKYNSDFATLLLWVDTDLKKEKSNTNKLHNDSSWFKSLQEEYGNNLEKLYANYQATNN